ncbi:MAG: 2-oxo acid dehydrogenase subunit E2 [Gemmatimonadetes bacterium]|nr:2-oxo acid dehydrogenase subunit E2 [Gemmatimonadota bacterium]
MATKVFMEALSPTMEEGRLVTWLKQEGDAVKSGEVLAEVETDKAVMELTARGDGVLRKQVVAAGTTAAVGTLVGIIAAADEDIAALLGGAAPGGATSAAPAASAPAVATPSVPAAPAPRAAAPAAPAAPATPAGRALVSPLARRLADESGVSLGAVQGSGPGGRIVKRDIEAALARGPVASSPAAPARASAPVRTGEAFEDIPLTQIRKTIAKRLSESIGPIPTFYLTAEFDLSRVAEMRTAALAIGDAFKVSFNDVILKAVATALTQHPDVNAHWLGDRIRRFGSVHLGMAVATDDGLIVPVIFDADQKGLRAISAEAKALAKKARERKLKPEEFTGSSFSVSNLGMMQIDQFTAIINPPEVGILAIGAIEDKVVVGPDGGFTVQPRLRVTMSCDHRAVDGAVGAAFLQTLRRLIENPLLLSF